MWLEKDQRGGRQNEEEKGIEREWKEMERRGRGRKSRKDGAEEAGVGVCKAGREEGIECGLASGA